MSAVTRTELRLYGEARFRVLLAAAKIPVGDTLEGHKIPLDKTLRKLGFPEASLPAPSIEGADIEDSYLLMDVFELEGIVAALAGKKQFTGGDAGINFKTPPEYDQASTLLKGALDRARAQGLDVGQATWEGGEFSAGFLGHPDGAYGSGFGSGGWWS